MSAQSSATATDTAQAGGDAVERTRLLLKIVYGLVPIAAGLDKFTNLLVDWTTYLPATVAGALPVEAQTFMYLVGVVEVAAGVVVLSRYTEYGAYLVAAWLAAVAVTVTIGGHYDVAVRDLVMAVGAVALAQLEAAHRAT